MSNPALAIAGFYDHDKQRERRAPDWGGDDLFTTAPPRRRGEHGVREWGEDGRYAMPRGRGAEVREHAPEPLAEAPAPRDLDRYLEPVPAGRRTVTITGQAGGFHTAVARRPARTMDERIAHRPERIASWTCALGFLLILLALLTAH